ncbi:MAG: hypothetical protein KA716_16675 [Gloeotrichia echinulata DEX184]|nr:hypothetical protein [Gloeotrichia echinulata DEX184]
MHRWGLGIGDWGHFDKLSASLGMGDWGWVEIQVLASELETSGSELETSVSVDYSNFHSFEPQIFVGAQGLAPQKRGLFT